MYKRKRSGPFGGGGTVALYSASKATGGPAKKRRRTFVPGKDRTGGYYGRYSSGKGEMKFHDNRTSFGVLDTSWGNPLSMNLIPQGSGENERIGRKCCIKKYICNWTCTVPSQTDPGLTDHNFSIVIVQDRQANGALANSSNVFKEDGALNRYQDFMNLENSNRFRVLYRKAHAINLNAGAPDGSTPSSHRWASKSIHGSIHLNLNIPIEFNSAFDDGRISTVRSNNILMFACATSNTPVFYTNNRVRYSDN